MLISLMLTKPATTFMRAVEHMLVCLIYEFALYSQGWWHSAEGQKMPHFMGLGSKACAYSALTSLLLCRTHALCALRRWICGRSLQGGRGRPGTSPGEPSMSAHTSAAFDRRSACR